MRNYLLIIIMTAVCLISNTNLLGQQHPGFTALQQKDYALAHSVFEAELSKKNTEFTGAYGMALLLSEADYQGFDLAKAYAYIRQCTDLYRDAKDKEKADWKELGITSGTLRQKREAIFSAAVSNAEQTGNAAAFEALLENFKLTYQQKTTIIQRRNELAFAEAKATETLTAMEKFLEIYDKDIQRYTPELRARADREIFELYLSAHGWSGLATFRSAYPGNIFTTDKGAAAFEAVDKERATSVSNFIRSNPESLLAPYAKALLEELRMEEQIALIRRQAPDLEAFVALQKLIGEDVNNSNWDVAIRKATQFADNFGNDKKYLALLQLLKAPLQNVQKLKYDTNVNSTGDEYIPTLSADGKRLYFCRQSEQRSNRDENVYVSEWIEGAWSKAVAIPELSKPGVNESPMSITSDGTRLMLFLSGEIAYSDKTVAGWSAVQHFPEPINGHEWQSDAILSSNGRVLLFTTEGKNRVGRLGRHDRDIYVSFKQKDGSWSLPANLGESINTSELERTPFLHPDMETLYFSSEGHGGLGGMDVFVSKRLDDSWIKWSEPVNLGKEINTTDDDWGYNITTRGDKAIFSANIAGNQEIFEVLLPEAMRPEKVNLLSGIVKGLDPKQSATIEVRDSITGDLIGEYRTEPGTGEYVVVLPTGIKPLISVRQKGSISVPKAVTIKTSEEGGTIETDLEVTSTILKPGEEISLSFGNLLFDTDQSEIKPQFYEDLKNLAVAVTAQQLSVVIEGHTDDVGSDEYNMTLSQRRADAVRAFLIQSGCPESHISAIGFGESKPRKPNTDEASRAANRRVEFRIKKK